MSALDYIYPYDPTGSATSNKIISEVVDVTPPTSSKNASFVVPRAAPFFADTLVIKTGISAGATKLIEGEDYILTHEFHAGSDALSRAIFGSVLFLNSSYTGRIYVTYQTLGGNYVLDDVSIVETLTQDLYSIRTVTWDQLKPLVAGFPPFDHQHSASEIIGLGELVDSTNRIAAAILDSGNGTGGTGGSTSGGSASLSAHIAATSNAHSKGAVGLGNVENYGIATLNDLANSSPNKYLTPATFREGLNIYSPDTTELSSDIAALSQEVAEQSTRFRGYDTSLNSLSVNISSITMQIDDMDINISTLTTNLLSAMDTVANFGTSLSNLSTTQGNIQVSLSALTDRMDTQDTAIGGLGQVQATHATRLGDILANDLSADYLGPLDVIKPSLNGKTGDPLAYNRLGSNVVDIVASAFASKASGGMSINNRIKVTTQLRFGQRRYGAVKSIIKFKPNARLPIELNFKDVRYESSQAYSLSPLTLSGFSELGVKYIQPNCTNKSTTAVSGSFSANVNSAELNLVEYTLAGVKTGYNQLLTMMADSGNTVNIYKDFIQVYEPTKELGDAYLNILTTGASKLTSLTTVTLVNTFSDSVPKASGWSNDVSNSPNNKSTPWQIGRGILTQNALIYMSVTGNRSRTYIEIRPYDATGAVLPTVVLDTSSGRYGGDVLLAAPYISDFDWRILVAGNNDSSTITDVKFYTVVPTEVELAKYTAVNLNTVNFNTMCTLDPKYMYGLEITPYSVDVKQTALWVLEGTLNFNIDVTELVQIQAKRLKVVS